MALQFKLPGINVRYIRADNMLYKVIITMTCEVPCDHEVFHNEVEDLLRAVIAMANLYPIKSDHLLAVPSIKPWSPKNKNLTKFSKNKNLLYCHDFVYKIRLRKLVPLVTHLPTKRQCNAISRENYSNAYATEPMIANTAETDTKPTEPEVASYRRKRKHSNKPADNILQENKQLKLKAPRRTRPTEDKENVNPEETERVGFVHGFVRSVINPIRVLFGK
ncbi:uncharacterized protein [Antedon mediterranea]|uniref:uncharacterized protein n=1 Tax=Antedon mediterranea TaxID=105859 RepID=UPI003AF841F6